MSANLPGGFNPHDPFASKPGGVYDPGALQGLYLRAQKGDLSARKYLQQIGVLGNQGQDIFAPGDVKSGIFAPAIDQWAAQTGSTAYGNGGFAYQPGWATANNDPNFSRTWDTWFQTGGTGTDFQPATQQGGSRGVQPAAITPQSPYGRTYTLPGHVNPGNLFGGGTDDGIGGYDPSADRQTFDDGRGTGGRSNTRDTMLRWFLDDARKVGIGDLNAVNPNNPQSDPAKVAQAAQLWATEVARMHRDFDKMGLDWQTSGFAKYDQYLAQPSGTPTVDSPAYEAQKAQQTTGTPQTTYTDPQTGKTVAYTGNADITATAKNLALQDPNNQDARLSYIMRQYGIDPTRGGLYTSSIARAISPQIEAFNQTRGLGQGAGYNYVDNTTSDLNQFAQQLAAPGGFGQIQQRARGLLGDGTLQTLAGGLTDPQTIDTLQTILAQAYAGSNPIYNQSRLGYFNQALGPGGSYGQYALDHPQTGAPGYQHPLDWLRGTQWANLLAGY